MHIDYLTRLHHARARQSLTQSFAQVCHSFAIQNGSLVNPTKDLIRSELLFPPPHKHLAPLFDCARQGMLLFCGKTA
jgi:hypothetical protein